MQLFYIINGWAGNNLWLDAAMRVVYIATIPVLATALAALLFFRPRRVGEYSADAPAHHEPSASRIALAALLSVAGCFLLFAFVQGAARFFLGSEILSPRPFVTHRVNALLVEPNDNSFPCIEAMLVGALAVVTYVASRRAALLAFTALLLHAFARIFCGTNYPIDVFVGALLGISLATLSLGACRVPLRSRVQRRARTAWNPSRQTVAASVALLTVFIGGAWSQNVFARFAAHQKTSPIVASTQITAAMTGSGQSASNHDQATHEGEGESPPQLSAPRRTGFQTRDMPPPGVINLGGYLPPAETYLRDVLLKEKLPHSLVSVDVAELKSSSAKIAAAKSVYRVASIRFAVSNSGARERRVVLRTAQQIVKSAFQADAQLQNVDVAAVVLNRLPQPSLLRVYAKGAVPVFTASVERKSLLPKKARDDNPGSWLRARSRLYFNERVLPAVDVKIPTPTPAPTPVPTVVPTPRPTAKPTTRPIAPNQFTPKQSFKPAPKPTAKPKRKSPAVKRAPVRRSTVKRVRRAPQIRRVPQIRRAPRRLQRRTRPTYSAPRRQYQTRPRIRRNTRYQRTRRVYRNHRNR